MDPHFTPDIAEPSNVTLRSVDGVEYHVHTARLAKYSDVFKDMFEASHSSSDPIQLHSDFEKSNVLDAILPFFYARGSIVDYVSYLFDIERLRDLQSFAYKFAIDANVQLLLVSGPLIAHVKYRDRERRDEIRNYKLGSTMADCLRDIFVAAAAEGDDLILATIARDAARIYWEAPFECAESGHKAIGRMRSL